jgi:hypothetical protein
MSRPDPQAATVAMLTALGAPTPWWPQTAGGHLVSDAQGQPLILVLPTAGRDQAAIARTVSRILNEAAGVPEAGTAAPLDPDHLDAVREETERCGRQMGRRVVGGGR